MTEENEGRSDTAILMREPVTVTLGGVEYEVRPMRGTGLIAWYRRWRAIVPVEVVKRVFRVTASGGVQIRLDGGAEGRASASADADTVEMVMDLLMEIWGERLEEVWALMLDFLQLEEAERRAVEDPMSGAGIDEIVAAIRKVAPLAVPLGLLREWMESLETRGLIESDRGRAPTPAKTAI